MATSGFQGDFVLIPPVADRNRPDPLAAPSRHGKILIAHEASVPNLAVPE